MLSWLCSVSALLSRAPCTLILLYDEPAPPQQVAAAQQQLSPQPLTESDEEDYNETIDDTPLLSDHPQPVGLVDNAQYTPPKQRLRQMTDESVVSYSPLSMSDLNTPVSSPVGFQNSGAEATMVSPVSIGSSIFLSPDGQKKN